MAKENIDAQAGMVAVAGDIQVHLTASETDGFHFDIRGIDVPAQGMRGNIQRSPGKLKLQLADTKTNIEALIEKTGPDTLMIHLSDGTAVVHFNFDRRREVASRKFNSQLPEGYLEFGRQFVIRSPGVGALIQKLARNQVTFTETVPLALKQLLAFVALDSFVRASSLDPMALLRFIAGGPSATVQTAEEGDCTDIAFTIYELCGGGGACLIVAVYYGILCGILSAL